MPTARMMRPTTSRTGTDCFGYADTDGDPWAGDYDRRGPRVRREHRRHREYQLAPRRRNADLDHRRAEREALAERGHGRGPVAAHSADFRGEDRHLHPGVASGRRRREQAQVARRPLLLPQRCGWPLPARSHQPGVRILRCQLQAEVEVLGGVRPARVRACPAPQSDRGLRYANEKKTLDYLNATRDSSRASSAADGRRLRLRQELRRAISPSTTTIRSTGGWASTSS